jgi:hypothetical protein
MTGNNEQTREVGDRVRHRARRVQTQHQWQRLVGALQLKERLPDCQTLGYIYISRYIYICMYTYTYIYIYIEEEEEEEQLE